MIRILFEVIILIVALAASGYSFVATKQLRELEKASAELQVKVAALDAERSASEQRTLELLKKERQFDAAKSAFASGSVLADLETAIAKSTPPTAEQQLALGGLRMLVKGSEDPDTLKSFQAALEMMEWPKQLKIMCAAKIGILATGNESKIPSDCNANAATPSAAEKTRTGKEISAQNKVQK